MVTRHARGSVTWIDMESPNPEELSAVVREFAIDPRIEEEIRLPTPYPLYMAFPKYLYLVLHFPTASASGGAREQEVDFIIGKKFLITVRYDVIESIHNLHKVFEAEELLGLPPGHAQAATLAERVFRRLYAAIRHEVEHAARRLERIEGAVFSGHERETVREISEAGRVLLRFDTTLARHGDPLKELLDALCTPRFFGEKFREHAQHIEAERAHVAALVSSYRAVATELRDTNDSLLSATQNEVMKTLTVITFTVLPLTLIAGIFGMNTEHNPIVGSSHDFWVIICLMLICSASVALFVSRKKWL
jgi:magnesium transporter